MAKNNSVQLIGRISSTPTEKLLPSSDVLVTFRIIVERSAAARKHSDVTVDTFDCVVWNRSLQSRALHKTEGDTVEISGELRRRFSKGPAGLRSFVSIEVHKIKNVKI